MHVSPEVLVDAFDRAGIAKQHVRLALAKECAGRGMKELGWLFQYLTHPEWYPQMAVNSQRQVVDFLGEALRWIEEAEKP